MKSEPEFTDSWLKIQEMKFDLEVRCSLNFAYILLYPVAWDLREFTCGSKVSFTKKIAS